MPWIPAGTTDEIDDGEALFVEREDATPIAVFRVEGQYFATDDTCTHDDFSLSDGYIDDDIVECPLHMAKFDIRTGKALCLPATEHLQTYQTKIDGDQVLVEVPD